MSSKTLGNLLRAVVIAVGLCGLFVCAYLVPTASGVFSEYGEELNQFAVPWLIFFEGVALPWFFILAFVWKVADAVKAEKVFTQDAAKWVKCGAVFAIADAMLVFVGNIVLLFLNLSFTGMFILVTIADMFVFALGVMAAVLARYLTKAAALQEESEGTL